MKKPKVFYLITSLNVGGTEIFLATLAKKLAGRYDISVGVLRSRGIIGEQLIKSGIKVTKCAMPWQISRYLRDNDIEILHTFLFWGHIMGRIGSIRAKTLIVIASQQAVDVWKKFYHTFLDKLTAPLCDYFIANSFAAKKRLENVESVPTGKIGVVYNGINSGTFNSPQSKEDIRKEFNIPAASFVMACVSRLHRDKGVDYLPEIALAAPGCVFIVAGDGPYRELLSKKIRDLKLENRFMLLGWRLDVARILKAADAFVLPSREESFPQAALEAMAAGLPVLASDVGGVKELVDDAVNGFLIETGDTGKFGAAITKLANDRPLVSRMSKMSVEKAAQFTEDRMITAVADIYKKLLPAQNDI